MNKNIRKKITVASTTDNLSKIREFIKTSADIAGFDKDISNNIVLAVDEASTNIIKHAYKYSSDGKIEISVSLRGKKFTISIIDSGTHFNSSTIPEPNLKQYYEEKRVGGLGMYLMKKLMDEVNYSQLKSNKNKVTLVKYIT